MEQSFNEVRIEQYTSGQEPSCQHNKYRNRMERRSPTSFQQIRVELGRCVERLDVPFLGSLPLDPRLARSCDEGSNFLADIPDSPVVAAFNNVLTGLLDACKEDKTLANGDT
ncbi:unnamed protein product [Timema podura]|uniref:Uncharacterized protein n=1 Tax=Timema podura TaxID=61482 RepID=A0ABN7PIC5_TIMPD|nr:unnamed protein product [Timema podura]